MATIESDYFYRLTKENAREIYQQLLVDNEGDPSRAYSSALAIKTLWGSDGEESEEVKDLYYEKFRKMLPENFKNAINFIVENIEEFENLNDRDSFSVQGFIVEDKEFDENKAEIIERVASVIIEK